MINRLGSTVLRVAVCALSRAFAWSNRRRSASLRDHCGGHVEERDTSQQQAPTGAADQFIRPQPAFKGQVTAFDERHVQLAA